MEWFVRIIIPEEMHKCNPELRPLLKCLINMQAIQGFDMYEGPTNIHIPCESRTIAIMHTHNAAKYGIEASVHEK